MPTHEPPPTRRTVLLAAAVLPLAGCSVFGTEEATPEPLPPSPDDLLRERVIAAEEALLALYAATIRSHPELEADLGGFTERHRRHADAVQATAPPDPVQTPPATATTLQTAPATAAAPDATPPATPVAPVVPADPATALQGLRDAEAAAAAERLADCRVAHDGELARVIAGVAACEASHDLILARVGG